MALTLDDLADLARACMKRAAQVPEPTRIEEDARAVLQRLVDDRAVRIKHRDAIKAVKRALAVDLQDKANRKGGIPRALGLVGGVAKGTSIEHLAIWMMMERLRDEGISKRPAARAVVDGFRNADLNHRLTVENVEQIWAREVRHWRGAKIPTRW